MSNGHAPILQAEDKSLLTMRLPSCIKADVIYPESGLNLH